MRRHPGVRRVGPGRYRITSEMRHPKTGRTHFLDRVVTAPDAATAASLRASARSEWLNERAARAARRERLGEALDAWLTEAKHALKPSTQSTYTTAVRWWQGVLGLYWLDALEPRDVREALAGAMDGGDAFDTASGRLRVLRTFAEASGHARIVEGVRMQRPQPEAERIEDEGRGLSLAELRRFLAAGPRAWLTLDGEVMPAWARAWALVELMAWTGMRSGEARALEWRDLDLPAGVARVRRSVWRGKVGSPKAAASHREVVLPECVVATLTEHRAAMMERHGLASRLVFPSRRSSGSGYVTNGHVAKSIARVCRVARIDLAGRPAVHVLRHTWNNVLRQSAPELVRQALVGHADESIGRRYSKVSRDEKRAAVGAVVQMVRGE